MELFHVFGFYGGFYGGVVWRTRHKYVSPLWRTRGSVATVANGKCVSEWTDKRHRDGQERGCLYVECVDGRLPLRLDERRRWPNRSLLCLLKSDCHNPLDFGIRSRYGLCMYPIGDHKFNDGAIAPPIATTAIRLAPFDQSIFFTYNTM